MDSEKTDERHDLTGIYGIPTPANERNPRQRRVFDQHERIILRKLHPNYQALERKLKGFFVFTLLLENKFQNEIKCYFLIFK